MTILLTGDIHGTHDIHKLSSDHFNKNNELNLTKDDHLIICGDFGLIWDYRGENDTEKYWLDWLEEKPWTTLFVDGNHECMTRLNSEFPIEEWNGGKIHRIRDSIIHLMRGQVFTIEDKKFFVNGGAYSHDIEYRTEGVSWWSQEVPSFCEREEAIANLADHDWKVDYVITHDAPEHIAGILVRYSGDWSRKLDEYERWLQEIADKLEFKQWFHGHHHQDIEFDQGKFQSMYNDIVALDFES